LYVYGSVTADGHEMNGETVKGTWASKGCDSSQGQPRVWEGRYDTYCEYRTFFLMKKPFESPKRAFLRDKMQDDRRSVPVSAARAPLCGDEVEPRSL
jgi:hypothetical protein